MAFFCINCKSAIDPAYKACPFCGEPVTDFLRKHLEEPIDGKYKIISRLGIGGMGEVYKVLHIHLNSVRVVKLMRPAISKEEDSNERFVREARLATRIHHPNVATLFDFSTLADGSYFMVWEYIEGMNLSDLLRAHGRLGPRYATRIAIQVLHGLEAVHRSGVVHRDISPENVMLTRDDDGDERVKIIDLGIAKQWSESADDKTKTGMFVGKWKYCSPEQLGMLKGSERIDARADIYSFGIVFYEMLTGVAPFLADSPHRYLLLHSTETPPPFSSRPEMNVPLELEALVFRALEKDRDRRFASARQFASALEAILPHLPDDPVAERADEKERGTIEAELLAPTVQTIAATDTSTEPTVISRNPQPEPVAARAAGDQTLAGLQEALPTQTMVPLPGRSRLPLAVAGALALIALVAFLLLRKPAVAPPVVKPDEIVTTPTTLALNAFPWGEVTSIRDVTSGREMEVGKVITPASIALPAGEYELTLTHPEFPQPLTHRFALREGAREEVLLAFEDVTTATLPDFGGGE